RGQHAAGGAPAGGLDLLAARVAGRELALVPVVEGAVVRGAVAVVLAVGLVVLGLVGGEVAQGEAVVGGDVVDRGPGGAQAAPLGQARRVLAGEHVGGAGQARGEVADPADPRLPGALAGGAVGQPESAHVVAEGVVPLGEGGGEVPRLPAAGAHVPRLGDELHVPQHGVGDDRAQQRVVGAEAAVVAAERGGEVEAEPVHVHLLHPVAQGGEDQVHRVHGAGVEGAAGSGDVLGDAVVGPVVLEV